KTRLFAENIHDVAISVRDAYETNKSIVTGDRVNNLILKLGGSVAGGFETDANKDLIVKGYNIMARHKDGKLGKFVNPYTVGLGIFLGTKAAQLGRKASIVAPVIGAGLIGGLKGYVNAETDMADTTLDMATGKMAPGAAPASSFKQKMSYVAGHIPEARRQEMVVSQEKISDLTSNIETLTEAVKSLENGAERREKIEQLRKVMADGQARMDVGLESSRDLFVYDDENSIDSNRQS